MPNIEQALMLAANPESMERICNRLAGELGGRHKAYTSIHDMFVAVSEMDNATEYLPGLVIIESELKWMKHNGWDHLPL